jgi:Fe-S oxidoreductase
MLTTTEKILFIVASLATILVTLRLMRHLVLVIGRGYGKPDWNLVPKRLLKVSAQILTFSPVFRSRTVVSILHGFVSWGFIYYLLVNLGDVLRGFIPDFMFLGEGWLGDVYRLGADVLSVAVLAGMLGLLGRRFLLGSDSLTVREATTLHPKAKKGIRRDSLIVGVFILFHVGARFVGESFHIAIEGQDVWQPFASAVANAWGSWSSAALEAGRHAGWWVAIGLILAFFPYFKYSKHLHLFMAPINFLLRPERNSMGELDPLDFEDESIEQFGVERLEHLSWSGIMDAYACIMCNRCQDACPAYETGKVLSPAALEINKRYFLNQEGNRLANGENSSQSLTQFAISHEAIWGCTACGACVEICPVANEPMRDILEIRRHLVLMENRFPEQLQVAYRGMERTANPWNIAPEERLKWAQGFDVPTIRENAQAEILWWVGCAPATDPRAQESARSFAKILNASGVNYAVLGLEERCTGDSARRSGNEYLFHELATSNVELLNEVRPKRIVTTCPHCLHTIQNEYPAFGGHYEVVHHTQLLHELMADGRLPVVEAKEIEALTFHDPCYLGRQNDIVEEPRRVLSGMGGDLVEMPRNGKNSFCCGAGGAQMWKEEEEGSERVSANRLREAEETGATRLAVGCPFCMIMLNDAAGTSNSKLQVIDIAELVADQFDKEA